MPKPLTNLPGEDGWTHVGRGGKRTFTINNASKPLIVTGNDEDTDATLDSTTREFDAKLKTWRYSSCCRDYHRMLSHHQPENGWSITKAVCLASGSFSRVNLTNRKRSMLQFAAFLETVRFLEAHLSQDPPENPIAMYAQDPLYTELDKEFLQSLGVTVLDIYDIRVAELGPAAEHLGEHTLLFELCMDTSINALRTMITSDIKLIGCSTFLGFLEEDRGQRSTVEGGMTVAGISFNAKRFGDIPGDNELATKFLRKYRKINIPTFAEDPSVFHGMAAQIRQPDEEEEEEG